LPFPHSVGERGRALSSRRAGTCLSPRVRGFAGAPFSDRVRPF
jgi:hypothetical protein